MSAPLTACQLIGYNLMRIRKTLGLDQAEARARLRPCGLDLAKNVYSAAERSYTGKRIRKFDADDLLAMSLAFEVPVAYFFLPPRPEDRSADAEGIETGVTHVTWKELVEALFDDAPAVALRLAELG